jgi:SAM-dependent methyltransferase
VTIRRFSDLASHYLAGVRLAVDLGCGLGEITCELARRHPDIQFVGCDHSPVAIEQGRRHAARLALGNVTFEQANLETFVPPAGTGLVMMFDAFHHLLDPAGFVRRVSRGCDRFFLIEPSGTALGSWNRRHDLDWVAATVFQLRDRLEFELGLESSGPASAPRPDSSEGAPTEHRYTASDFDRFFHGFDVTIRGTIAGLEQYGPAPQRTSALRDRLGDAAYELLVAVDDVMFEEGVDLAAKHWAIYASHDGAGAKTRRPRRQPAVAPLPAGLLPAYAATYRDYEGPTRARCGESFQATLRVTNAGWRPWSSLDSAPVMASYHWLDAGRRALVSEGMRTPLAAAIAPGETAVILVRIHAPDTAGTAILSIDLVHEGVTWLSDQGVVPLQVRFTIEG